MSEPTKARKGDLILVKLVTYNYWSLAAVREAKAIGRELPGKEITYAFGVVASATRDGQAKTWHPLVGGDRLVSSGYAQQIGINQQRWVIPAKKIDITAALTAAAGHCYPGSETPRAFPSFEAAKEAVRPFLTAAGHADKAVA